LTVTGLTPMVGAKPPQRRGECRASGLPVAGPTFLILRVLRRALHSRVESAKILLALSC